MSYQLDLECKTKYYGAWVDSQNLIKQTDRLYSLPCDYNQRELVLRCALNLMECFNIDQVLEIIFDHYPNERETVEKVFIDLGLISNNTEDSFEEELYV